MRTVRALSALFVAGALTLSACGGEDEPTPSTDNTATSAEPTPSEGDEPVPEGTAPENDGSQEGDDGSAIEASDICTLVTAEEIGSALGATVMMEEIPGGGCNFAQSDPKAPSVALNSMPLDEQAGGFEAARIGVTSVVKGQAQDLPDTGDQAFLVVGPALGSDSVQGACVIELGESLVQVTVVQGQDLPEPDVGQLTIDVATLVGSKG